MPRDLASRRRLTVALALMAIFAYETYALFLKRSGETAFTPPFRERQLSPEIAGDIQLEQTFEMQADGLDLIRLYARPSSAPATGNVHLTLVGDTYAEPVARRIVPASELLAAPSFEWALPLVDRSSDRIYTIRVTLPDATPGHGIRFEIGTPLYARGDLSIGGRSFWGDLRFETHAARVRLIDSLAALRRQAAPGLRSDLVVVLAFILLNAAIVLVVLRLPDVGASPNARTGHRQTQTDTDSSRTEATPAIGREAADEGPPQASRS